MSIITTNTIMIITIMTIPTSIITTTTRAAPVPARAALPSASTPPWKS